MQHSAPPLVPEEAEEVRSRGTPSPPNTEWEADAVMAEVNALVTEGQEGESLLADAGKASGSSRPHPSTAPESPRHLTAHALLSGEGVGEPMSALNTSTRAAAG